MEAVQDGVCEVLRHEIDQLGDEQKRIKTVWHSLDDYRHQFVGSMPVEARTTTSNEVFHTAFQIYMGVTCRAVTHMVGSMVANSNAPCDPYGDVMASSQRGTLPRTRHDTILSCIRQLAKEAKMRISTEVQGLFSGVIQQVDDEGDEANTDHICECRRANRRRKGLVPDVKYHPINASAPTLMDVKTMSCCKSHYGNVGPERKAVAKREREFDADYKRKARAADIKYNACQADSVTGPVREELGKYGRVLGLAIGCFGEVSTDVRYVVTEIARHRSFQYRSLGEPNPQAAEQVAKRHARKVLGIEAVRTYAIMIIEGTRLAAARAVENDGTPVDPRKKEREQQAAYESYLHTQFETTYGHGRDLGIVRREWC